MSRIIRSLLDPCIYIRVDWDKKAVTEASYRCSGKPLVTAERNDDEFEQVLYKALATLGKRSARELKEVAKSDKKLKAAFDEIYERKLKVAQFYKIDDD